MKTAEGDALEAEVSIEAAPAALFDALVLPGGDVADETLKQTPGALDFVRDQHRHCKPILVLNGAASVLEHAGLAWRSGNDPDPGLLRFGADELREASSAFLQAIGRHRFFERAGVGQR